MDIIEGFDCDNYRKVRDALDVFGDNDKHFDPLVSNFPYVVVFPPSFKVSSAFYEWLTEQGERYNDWSGHWEMYRRRKLHNGVTVIGDSFLVVGFKSRDAAMRCKLTWG